jgi:long-chain-fatty-acid--CoA ligase ACSBG
MLSSFFFGNANQKAKPYVADAATHQSPPPAAGLQSTVSPSTALPIRLAQSGIAAITYDTFPASVKKAASMHGNKVAIRQEKPGYPKDKEGEWRQFTYTQYYQEATQLAKAFVHLGLEPWEGVAICGFNAPEWHFSFLASTMIQALPAGTYTTNSAEACAYIVTDSKCKVVMVDTIAQAKKYVEKRGEMPTLQKVVVWGEAVPAELGADEFVVAYATFIATGAQVADSAVEARLAKVKVDECATLIYTSGTTGNPKAVMQSHDSIFFSAECASERANMDTVPEWHVMSYLPMSHIAAQMVDLFMPLVGTLRNRPGTVHFARPDALKGSLPISLKAIRPTFFFGVPRVWEKLVEGIKAKGKAAPATGLKKKIIDFSKNSGLETCRNKQLGGTGHVPRGLGFANAMVHSKAKAALGLDRCSYFLTGAAPIQLDTLEFLASLGIDVMEVYGMSESCGIATLGSPKCFRFGSCGARLTATELKVDHVEGRDKAGEGELCFRGRHVMMGYMNNQAKTDEAIDAEGWLHSGDIGKFTDGLLNITGRLKELIIGAGGENIAPVPMEDALKKEMPAISNAVIIGDKRKYLVCLLTLKSKPDLETGDFHDELVAEAVDVNPEVTTVTAALADAKWKAYLDAGLVAYNKTAPSNAHKLQKWVLLAKDLSVPAGDLTATLKLKRSVVEAAHADKIDALYGPAE